MSQVALSMFDYKIHTSSEVFMFFNFETNNTRSFYHLCLTHSAKYYGYLWSDVFACDMFLSRFKKEGIFNLETGLSYRKNILEPGSTM
ncbi:hypothetical protein MXB_5089, partial [Myxobolus squamalis]